MNITVMSVGIRLKDRCMVTFHSEQGTANAYFAGEAPIVGSQYEVEIDIPNVLIWDMDVTPSETAEYSIKNEREFTILTGQLESSFDEGCYDVRLGSSLISLELLGDPYPMGTYVQIKVRTQSVMLYKVNL